MEIDITRHIAAGKEALKIALTSARLEVARCPDISRKDRQELSTAIDRLEEESEQAFVKAEDLAQSVGVLKSEIEHTVQQTMGKKANQNKISPHTSVEAITS